ncbi:pro-neuregulin-4, membrane-bound isoform [Xenopus laevis]|uniref:Pro-neuregulin-4, membrane-bound isoform n=2 Tax=Xenopus laevis TaxID=8355 RepID=A0A1L8GZS6_XENLA|nr:pro-neuregulin-4, membrane-bound isoform [Xenopus laevis]XP_041442575.1 pro-neuregulin-4, membrane-bound isoform [Xenopus laevis]OCT89348.1 hypothetical protein XELAEV_18017968mg [Xenopus laevis]
MTTGHGEPCDTDQSLFCLNGGVCYMVPSVSSPFCRCIGIYTGVRCEAILLSSEKTQPQSDSFIHLFVLAIFMGLFFLGFICCLCRNYRRKLNNQSGEEL